jgi:hypothetical protein
VDATTWNDIVAAGAKLGLERGAILRIAEGR